MDLEKIRIDLASLADHACVIFGSRITGMDHARSDIDVAIISQMPDPEYNINLWNKTLGQVPPIYDVKIFELLPLQMKIRIANNFETIFGDRIELAEYFYHFRKLWKDCKHRIEENKISTMKEKIMLLKQAHERDRANKHVLISSQDT
jgi:uncharacterized protein